MKLKSKMNPLFTRPLALTLIAVLMLMSFTPIDAHAQAGNIRGLSVPISQGDFSGTLTITRFERQGDGIVAIGTVAGTVAPDATVFVRQVAVPVQDIVPGSGERTTAAAVVAQQTGVCNILSLVLGPLHLDLLGLVVDLNQVILNITGETGAGNLLGNLLCAITGLLDPSGTGTGLVGNVLNQV